MIPEATSHLINKISNTPIKEHPFPYLYNVGIFPDAFYAEILRHMPAEVAYRSLLDGGLVRASPESQDIYMQRSVISLSTDLINRIEEGKRSFWIELTKTLSSPEFSTNLVRAFQPWFDARFGENSNLDCGVHIDLNRDSERWALGPHTDAWPTIAVILFYLPTDDTTPHLGTSIYTPKDPAFTCKGGPHHDRELFNCAYFAPYVRNSAFAFFKNDRSFHGVEAMKKPGEVKYSIQLSIIRAI